MSDGLSTMTSCMSRYLRQKGEALVNEQTDGQSSGMPKNPITYIQVIPAIPLLCSHFDTASGISPFMFAVRVWHGGVTPMPSSKLQNNAKSPKNSFLAPFQYYYDPLWFHHRLYQYDCNTCNSDRLVCFSRCWLWRINSITSFTKRSRTTSCSSKRFRAILNISSIWIQRVPNSCRYTLMTSWRREWRR